jgi:DNA helicase-2/ATP-dependent DNA helicase PcrA
MRNPLPANTVNNAASLIPFPDEMKHLADMKEAINEDIQFANQSVSVHDSTYMDTKRYMAEHCGEIDPHEMFQNELLLKQLDRAGAISVQARDRLTKLLDSPYFARIDFHEEKGETSAFYIGKYAFLHRGKMLIVDWRSPVAGMFYDFEIGPAWYSAPACLIHGELTRKWQFRIRGGEMEYALESSVSIRDDVMQRELSLATDEKMKSIIATIQKEQNLIIGMRPPVH